MNDACLVWLSVGLCLSAMVGPLSIADFGERETTLFLWMLLPPEKNPFLGIT